MCIYFFQIQLLDPAAKLKWRQCKSLPHPRKHVQAVQVDDKLYIGSGYGNNDDISSMVYCLDLNSEDWINCPKSLTLQYAMAKFDGKIILIGGNMKINGQPNPVVQYSAEPQANAEVQIQPGAIAANSAPVIATGRIQYLSENSREWKFFSDEEMPPMPTPRLGAVAVSFECNLVVAGGYGNSRSRIRVVEIYDKPSRSWYSGINLPCSAAELKGAVVHGNDWYLLGGASQARNAAVSTSLKELIRECVRPPTPPDDNQAVQTEGIWTMLPALPHASSSTVVFGGSLVALGGEREGIMNSSLYSDIHVYDPHGQQWIHVANMPCALSKCTAVSLSSGDVLVMGGYSKKRKPDSVMYRCSLLSTESMREGKE